MSDDKPTAPAEALNARKECDDLERMARILARINSPNGELLNTVRYSAQAMLKAAARIRKLHAALRAIFIVTQLDFESRCDLCGGRWPNPKNERHAPGCLASPDSAAEQGGAE